ncbi:MAG: trans-sulfuration enzyme family protein [Flavobacteriales bacterium AspAUS03]
MKAETKLIHSISPDSLTGAISTPIYQTSTYVQEAPGINKGFDYTRTNNPTRKILEETIATLENGRSGLAFASGLAAIDAVLKLLNTGDEIIAVDNIYGGTFRVLTTVYNRLGIEVKFVDTTESENVTQAISDKTKMIWLESPTNPMLKISDIATISRTAKAHKAWIVVDNTFASPALQNPLDLGVDIVIHSATKYLSGHSDVLAGLTVVRDLDLADRLKYIQNTTGGVLSPFNSWLTIRGIQTLYLRMEKQSTNASKIADFLNQHQEVDKLYYPGLTSHKNHTIAAKQQRAFGGIVSFSFKNDTIATAEEFITSTVLFKLAESLGGTKSLLCHPATMTHKSIPEKDRHAIDIQDSLIRLSCGIEHVNDLIEDLEQAFAQIKKKKIV